MTPTEVAGASRNKWLPWLSVVLLIVGVGIGVILGRVTKADTPDLATTAVTKMIADYSKAVNAGDAAAIATFFAPNATLTDMSSDMAVVTSNMTIAKDLVSMQKLGFFVDNSGTAIQRDNVVAQASTWGGGSGVVVYQLGTDGKIMGMWVHGNK